MAILGDIPQTEPKPARKRTLGDVPSTPDPTPSEGKASSPPIPPAAKTTVTPTKKAPATASVAAAPVAAPPAVANACPTCGSRGIDNVRSPALEELRKHLTDAERAELAESMLLHHVPEDHPIISVALERILNRRYFELLNRRFEATADRVENVGRVLHFVMSPSMSLGLLLLAAVFLAAGAYTIGGAVAGARLHETMPLSALFLALGITLGAFITLLRSNPKPTARRMSSW
jgi:hypothetical protein